jgi:hypothetical protein
VIGVQLILHKNLVGTDRTLSVHIADTEIGIRPGNVRALAGIETKDPGPVDGSDLDQFCRVRLLYSLI